jgi:hypothetical protein
MKLKNIVKLAAYSMSVFAKIVLVVLVFIAIPVIYYIGFSHGYKYGQFKTELVYNDLLDQLASSVEIVNEPEGGDSPPPSTRTVIINNSLIKQVNWGGPDLWVAVNRRRQEFGVNPLSSAEDLCTIASLRLNELLELGKLDGHEGFGNLQERRPDLSRIFENYSSIAEFLLAGADSADEAVALWENTLGHKKLLTGGEFVWGCIYAQNSFAVAITAY